MKYLILQYMNKKRSQETLFYKYRVIDKNTKNLIQNNEFCFSSPVNYNDPFDSAFWIHIEGTKEEWEWFTGVSGNELQDILKFGLKKTRRNTYVPPDKCDKLSKDYPLQHTFLPQTLCLSRKNDSILMWAHYASNHQGICLSFKADYFEENLGFYFDSEFLPLYKVKYTRKLPGPMNLITMGMSENTINFFITKYSDWKYEEEWRLLLFPQNVRWKQTRTMKKFRKEALEGIIFGLYTSKRDVKDIYKLINKNYLEVGYNVNFYICKWIKGKYAIKPEKIDSIEDYISSI